MILTKELIEGSGIPYMDTERHANYCWCANRVPYKNYQFSLKTLAMVVSLFYTYGFIIIPLYFRDACIASITAMCRFYLPVSEMSGKI